MGLDLDLELFKMGDQLLPLRVVPQDESPAGFSGPARSSGSDSSCPAASPATAGSATVSAPAGVRAIRGDGSATVVWCPPASGAGSVVSYTVTSSGGQSVTAKVPDDWAIVTGLTDGTGYTFTVTANTASASGPASAATQPVTPAPPAPPAGVLRGGQPQQVSYDASSLLIGGKRVFITAGEFDPWRTRRPRCGSMTCRR